MSKKFYWILNLFSHQVIIDVNIKVQYCSAYNLEQNVPLKYKVGLLLFRWLKVTYKLQKQLSLFDNTLK